MLFDSTALQAGTGGWHYTVLYSLLEVHALPTLVNLVDGAILKSAADTSTLDLQTTSRSYTTKASEQLTFNSGGIYIAIALASPATTLVAFVVRDKELKTRHQLSVMGMPSHVYWAGLFIHDCMLYSIPALGSVVIMIFTKAEPMGRRALGPYTLLICMFVPAIVLFSHILSFMYKKHLLVYQTIPLLMQFSSIGAYVAVSVLSIVPSTQDTAKTVNTVCTYLLPHYTVIGASTFMQQQYIEDKLMGQDRSYWENEQVKQALWAYAIMIPSYYAALVALDRLNSYSRPSTESVAAVADPDGVDAGVQAEEARAMDQAASYSIRARKLRKTYDVVGKDKSKGKTKLVAVNALSLTVSEGECLGLLGPNGAGKTTTIRMLTAEETIDGGEAVVNGFDVATQSHKCWGSLGFCPQHDALWVSGPCTHAFVACDSSGWLSDRLLVCAAGANNQRTPRALCTGQGPSARHGRSYAHDLRPHRSRRQAEQGAERRKPQKAQRSDCAGGAAEGVIPGRAVERDGRRDSPAHVEGHSQQPSAQLRSAHDAFDGGGRCALDPHRNHDKRQDALHRDLAGAQGGVWPGLPARGSAALGGDGGHGRAPREG